MLTDCLHGVQRHFQHHFSYIMETAPVSLTLSQTTNFRLSKLKQFADNNFKFDEDGRQFSKWVETTVRKGEIARYEQFLLFPQWFQITYTADMEKPGLVLERVILHSSPPILPT